MQSAQKNHQIRQNTLRDQSLSERSKIRTNIVRKMEVASNELTYYDPFSVNYNKTFISMSKPQTNQPTITGENNETPFQPTPQTPAPREPLDLHVILGDEESGGRLANLTTVFQLKPEGIQDICYDRDIDFSQAQSDTIMCFDFVTEEGREKEAIEYFENGLDRFPRNQYDPNLSPLQNWFSRPSSLGKLELVQSNRKDKKKGVTLRYRFYTSEMQNHDLRKLRQLLNDMVRAKFHPDAKLEMKIGGYLDTFKKNRIRLSLDHISAHLTSKEFRLAQLLELMKVMKVFGEDEREIESITSLPPFKLLQKSEEIQGTVRFNSLRKMLQLYQVGIGNSYQENQKESLEVIKGLFKGDLRFTLIFQNKIAIAANFQYESESVLIRLLSGIRKYSELFD